MVSTELALLQSNMTYLNEKRGPQYHWVIKLFRLLKLSVFGGVHAALEAFNEQRKAELDRKKTDRCKRRRIELKVERTLDSQLCKKWSKKHGHDTVVVTAMKRVLRSNQKEARKGKHQIGGSVGHVGPPLIKGLTTEIVLLTRGCGKLMLPQTWRMRGHPRTVMSFINQDDLSDVFSSEGSVASSVEEDIISMSTCTCGTLSRAHKIDCPMSL